jgi:uncharacterized protein (DUF608 family)
MIRTTYSDEYTGQISFPLGGIGSGCIGLAGNGRLVDWEIFNRPGKGSDNGYSHIAVKAERGGNLIDARVLNGDVTTELTGRYGHGYGSGLPNNTMAGFPHFLGCTFNGTFPLSCISFTDKAFPGDIKLYAFNPLIPQNDRDSSIPAAFFEIEIINTSCETTDYSVAMSLRNPYGGSRNSITSDGGFRAIHLEQTIHAPDSPEYGDMTLATDGGPDGTVSYQEYWYRGSWYDCLETYWRGFTEKRLFENRSYNTAGNGDTATLCVRMTASPGEKVRVRFIISWNRPNCYNYWNPYKEKTPGGEKDITWKNYYATIFEDSLAAALYSLLNWDRLLSETLNYKEIMFSSSLPDEVIEAAASAVAVLKSPTVLRLENGEFYGWEGTNENWGSCEGTCTHVWNYAYALAFLFPSLERSIRETDFKYNQDENGRMSFRMQLPLMRERSGHRACVDGQMGGVIKTYREWKICGSDDWLRSVWEPCKKSLEYAWSESNYDKWDADGDGVLEGRQHHTLDMELFGPSSWLEGFYLAALKAGAEMARHLGDIKSAEKYMTLFEKGKKWSDENLWNGEYFIQKIDLTDKKLLGYYGDAADIYWNDEAGEIKYQIGEGCEIDQLCAQWHANVCGLGEIFDREKTRTALKNLYKNNFKHTMRDHYNTFRIFALNDEAGAVICDYPVGAKKPAIPIPYAQESMHGFEYQLAALMMSEGMIDEGVEIVRSIRGRYNGKNRNPWNEIECGSNYARSMASFSMLPLLSGFGFNMQEKTLSFDPKINRDNFRCFWSVDGAWGRVDISCSGAYAYLGVSSGVLELYRLSLPFVGTSDIGAVYADGNKIPFTTDGNYIVFGGGVTIRNALEIKR